MASLAAEIRRSTLRSLKLTCPSAEITGYDTPSASAIDSTHSEPHPFTDASGEHSDEEELIPHYKNRTQCKPRFVEVTVTSAETSSERSSYTWSSCSQISKNESILISPTSPSSLDTGIGSDEEDLFRRFCQATKERDLLWRALQSKKLAPYGIPGKASIVYKSEEKTLIEEVHALRNGIQIWTEEYFGGPMIARFKKPHIRRAKWLFKDLTEEPNSYLENPEDRPLLIQAYIWSQLQQKVFSNWQQGCGYIWAGKLGDKQLRPINDTLRNAVKNKAQAEEYHHWRANTVNLLVPQVDGKWRPTFDATPVLKSISHLCSRLRSKLRPWSTRSLRSGKEQLRTIVSASVALDLKMKRQRPDYRFVTFTMEKDQCWGYEFFDSEMEDIYEGDDGHGTSTFGRDDWEGRKVELALAPALERCGNAQGHVLDQTLILIKADVSCKKLEKPTGFSKCRDDIKTRQGAYCLGRTWNKI